MAKALPRFHSPFAPFLPLLFALFLWGSASMWEGILFLLGGAVFLRRPVLASLTVAALPAVSPSVRVLLLAMVLYALLHPLLSCFFGFSAHPRAALSALLSAYAAFWLSLPAVVLFAGLFLLSLGEGHRPLPTATAMLSATLAGLCFLLALPLFYL